jgi:hypothetical protein
LPVLPKPHYKTAFSLKTVATQYLDFVKNEQGAMPIAQLAYATQKRFSSRNNSALKDQTKSINAVLASPWIGSTNTAQIDSSIIYPFN